MHTEACLQVMYDAFSSSLYLSTLCAECGDPVKHFVSSCVDVCVSAVIAKSMPKLQVIITLQPQDMNIGSL